MFRKICAVLIVAVLFVPVSVYAGKYDDLLVQADGNCSKPCVVIGRVRQKKVWAVGSCVKKLKKYAKKKYDADAILKYEVGNRGDARDQCQGIAVRWAKDGESGIMQISDSTPIPVIDQ